eukprot:m.492560 g.492560  ORF g.492560 m.492560 type:complete len:170 (-) comp33083_c0_seq1:25-534(-)
MSRVVENAAYEGESSSTSSSARAADVAYVNTAELEAARYDSMSVRELKQLLVECGIDPSGCIEKEELRRLAKGTLVQGDVAPVPGGAGGVDVFLKGMLGSGPAMAADFELRVREFSIKQLKAHLQSRGIDTTGCVEKDDYLELALKGIGDTKPTKELGTHEVADHLLEA